MWVFPHYLHYTACIAPRNMLCERNSEKLFLVPFPNLEIRNAGARELGIAISLFFYGK